MKFRESEECYNFLEKKKRREKSEQKIQRASERGSLALEDKERTG
jgi:hypothetical protein|tara:strand:+ start:475 stop:609 length:135 start_codon:yes stop_codon:yes gene_type:complete